MKVSQKIKNGSVSWPSDFTSAQPFLKKQSGCSDYEVQLSDDNHKQEQPRKRGSKDRLKRNTGKRILEAPAVQ